MSKRAAHTTSAKSGHSPRWLACSCTPLLLLPTIGCVAIPILAFPMREPGTGTIVRCCQGQIADAVRPDDRFALLAKDGLCLWTTQYRYSNKADHPTTRGELLEVHAGEIVMPPRCILALAGITLFGPCLGPGIEHKLMVLIPGYYCPEKNYWYIEDRETKKQSYFIRLLPSDGDAALDYWQEALFQVQHLGPGDRVMFNDAQRTRLERFIAEEIARLSGAPPPAIDTAAEAIVQ